LTTHRHWEDGAAAYALHALDDPERRAFEQHLADCQRCRDEVAAMRTAVETLPAPSLVEPPRELKQRVMASVRAEAGEIHGRPRGFVMPALALASAGAVAAIVVLTIGGTSARTYPGQVSAPGASASLRVTGQNGRLRVTDLPAPPAGRIYEVWLKRGGPVLKPSGTLFAAGNGSVAVAGSLNGVREVLVTAEPRPHGSRAPTRPPIIVVRLKPA
jgi:anti-sigma-K factor RskA